MAATGRGDRLDLRICGRQLDRHRRLLLDPGVGWAVSETVAGNKVATCSA
ncbi:MAG: hypothetical protein AB7T37_05790 [Dehalococcoidia bacterium]